MAWDDARVYGERVSGVPDAVLWWSTSPAAAAAERRVLPDGCMDVIWADGTLLVAGRTPPRTW